MYRLPALDRWRGLLALCLLLLALQQASAAAVIHAKAWMAPVLIERAWQRSLALGGIAVKPWPWADTWPVARLSAPEHGVELLVLAGDSGNALAFGPGLALASARPGSGGTAVIAGHRDTHFAFLARLEEGDALQLQLPDAGIRRYLVGGIRVVDAHRENLPRSRLGESLLLVTCYPFDTLRAGGPLRYTVSALPWNEAIAAGVPVSL